jgi:4-methyl-5(b-hydroxyethyl)-thiazole monophosphate biosynthesis
MNLIFSQRPNVLLVLEEGFEEIETVTPVDILRRAGANVIICATRPGDLLTLMNGKSRIGIVANEVMFDEYDERGPAWRERAVKNCVALVIPGGPAVTLLRKNKMVTRIVNDFHAAGRIIGAICAAPLVLKDAGVLDGRRYTAFPGCRDELPDAQVAEKVVRDGNIITSRSAGTALDFSLALVAAIWDDAKAAAVAEEIFV